MPAPKSKAVRDSVANGPVAQNVKEQQARTAAEFSNLAASRQTPAAPAATGQPLTHYHSFFSELLSWNNPRASAIAYATIVSAIFAFRYLDLFRWVLKLTWMALSITVSAEVVGKLILNSGLATQFRPRKYYTVSRETLDALIGDVDEFVNFFVIEFQRILFAENIFASTVTLLAAFISYFLVQLVPFWGFTLIATSTAFLVPLVYTTNQELIDSQVKQASDILNAQATQLRSAAQKHTSQATQLTKQYMGDYTAKAQQMVRGRSASPEVAVPELTATEYKAEDFPAAPKDQLKVEDSIKSEYTESEQSEQSELDGANNVVKHEGGPLIAA